MATTSPTNAYNVLLPARRFLNTDGLHQRFRFPKNAKRHTDDQMKIVYNARSFLGLVVTGKRGLVFSNFALAEAVNSSIVCHFQIVRYSDMTKEHVRTFVQNMIDLAHHNNWGDDILAVELQFLETYH